MMLKKRRILISVNIVVLFCLIGTLFNVYVAGGGRDKEEKDEDLWKAIRELQAKVDSLNASLVKLEGQIRPPRVITSWELERVFIPGDDGWHDVICISDVSIKEGSDVVVIAHAGIDDGYLKMRIYANSTFFGWHRIDRVGPSYAYGEFHVVFKNMSAGTYTFALKGRTTYPGSLGVHTRRLTLICIQSPQ